MKKIGLIALMLGATIFSNAQIGMWLGGIGSFNSTTMNDGNGNKTGSMNMGSFGPTVGFMLGERPAVGINLLFNNSATKDGDGNDVSSSSGYMVEPFFRYYTGESNFKFFGDLKVGFGGGTNKEYDEGQEDPEQETQFTNFGVNVCPGIQYWFNDAWSIAATVGQAGYNSTTNKDNGGNKTGTVGDFGLTMDFSTINFLFFWHF